MHAYGLACIRARTHVRMLSCTYVRIFLRRRQAGSHGRTHAHTDACACIHAFIPNCLRVMHVFAYFHCLKQAAIKISSLANNLNENQREREREREREEGVFTSGRRQILRYSGQRYYDVVNVNQSFQRNSAKRSLLHLTGKRSLLAVIFLNSTGLSHQMC